MKVLLIKWITAVLIVLSLSSIPLTSQAYTCGWRNGHRVCWHHRHYHCYWVKGYWRHGYYHPSHKVCSY